MLGILIGLGFGITEMVLYIFVLGVPPLARIPGVVFHASSAGIVAYGIARKLPLPFYLIAVGLHMANNYVAIVGELFFGLLVQMLVLITAFYLAWYFYHRASKEKIVV